MSVRLPGRKSIPAIAASKPQEGAEMRRNTTTAATITTTTTAAIATVVVATARGASLHHRALRCLYGNDFKGEKSGKPVVSEVPVSPVQPASSVPSGISSDLGSRSTGWRGQGFGQRFGQLPGNEMPASMWATMVLSNHAPILNQNCAG